MLSQGEPPGRAVASARVMIMKKYIHYGPEPFDRDLIEPIRNRQYFTKPWGGLWASPVDAEFGWKQWCEQENFARHRFGHSFIFTLSPEAKVLTISSSLDLHDLPLAGDSLLDEVQLDFEELVRQGYDAVELELSRDGKLYWALYGWDCDSIVILNRDVIVEVSE